MNKNYFKTLLVVAAAAVTGQAKAQLVNCNVFMKGNYVEVGVNWNGAYGTSAPVPAGYAANALAGLGALYNECDSIAHTDSTRLGFVADPDMDGWSVGTPPFYGDFFVPGYPQEGWSIMADGGQANNWNALDYSAVGTGLVDSNVAILDSIIAERMYDTVLHVWDTLGYTGSYHHVFSSKIPGSNISYATSGSTVTGTWQGSYDSVAVRQVTTLDTNELFFTVTITLTNLASTARNNVYYLRSVDPDNDIAEGGSFTTFNKIENQLPNPANLSVVSATGTVYSHAYLAMGTTDIRGKAFYRKDVFGPDALLPCAGTLDQIYAEADTMNNDYGTGDTLTADVAIGLVFNIGHLASVDTVGAVDSAGRVSSSAVQPNRAVFSYYYSFKKNVSPLSVKDHINDPAIKVYPNPATNTVSITGLATTDHVKVYDIMGRNAAGNWAVQHDGSNTFNIEALPAGSYIIIVADKDGNIRSRKQLQKQ